MTARRRPAPMPATPTARRVRYTVSLKVTGSGGSTTHQQDGDCQCCQPGSRQPPISARRRQPALRRWQSISPRPPRPDSTTFNWNFGDGATGSGSSVSHSYSASGNYTVTLTASGTAGSTTNDQARLCPGGQPARRGVLRQQGLRHGPDAGRLSRTRATVRSTPISGRSATERRAPRRIQYTPTASRAPITVSLKVTGPAGTKTQTRSRVCQVRLWRTIWWWTSDWQRYLVLHQLQCS